MAGERRFWKKKELRDWTYGKIRLTSPHLNHRDWTQLSPCKSNLTDTATTQSQEMNSVSFNKFNHNSHAHIFQNKNGERAHQTSFTKKCKTTGSSKTSFATQSRSLGLPPLIWIDLLSHTILGAGLRIKIQVSILRLSRRSLRVSIPRLLVGSQCFLNLSSLTENKGKDSETLNRIWCELQRLK